MLTKDQILGAKDINMKEVEVPEWGGKVMVKALTGAERDTFEASIIEIRNGRQVFNMKNVRAKLCSLAICDEEGNRMFTDAEVFALSNKSANALNRIFDVAASLSGLSTQEFEFLEKGSKARKAQEDFTSD